MAEESRLDLEYLISKYRKAHGKAEKGFSIACMGSPESPAYAEELEHAWNFLTNAEEYMKIIKEATQNMNLKLPQMLIRDFESLPNLRDKLYFASEFPHCHEEVRPLYLDMMDAVGREDYETAAKLRDEIESVVSSVVLKAQPL